MVCLRQARCGRLTWLSGMLYVGEWDVRLRTYAEWSSDLPAAAGAQLLRCCQPHPRGQGSM
jgi:hypothetical protein